jgi:hypothetical protein
MAALVRRAAAVGVAVTLAILTVGCVRGEGPVTTELREVRPFSRIEAGGGIAVVFRTGPAAPVEVRAQESVVPVVVTEVGGETLTIEARDDIISAEPVTVTVTAPTLVAISLTGGASADVGGLDVEALEVSARGGSQATIAGAADGVRLTAGGGSRADLAALAARDVEVALDGGATVAVHASGSVSGVAGGGSALTVTGGAEAAVVATGGARVTSE